MAQRVLLVDRVPHERMDGVGRYMTQLARHLPADGDPPVRVLWRGRALRPAAWLAQSADPLRAGRPRLTRLDRRWLQPLALQTTRAALVHFPYHNLPANWHVGRRPLIVSVHGAAAVEEPAWGVPPGRAALIRRNLAAAGDRLRHVITVSAWAKDEIVAQWGLDPARVTPIWHGIDHALFRPAAAGAPRPPGVPAAPYILHLGPCAPRKNVTTLLEAFAVLRQRARLPHVLVLAGRDDERRRALLARAAALGVADAVHAPGAVDDAQLADLYRHAACFVFPSLYEGFGIPVLEAMACGTPVITSGCTALPEVAGGAAWLLDEPRDVDGLAAALHAVIADAAVRATLSARGVQRAAHFTWQATADRHLHLYRTLL